MILSSRGHSNSESSCGFVDGLLLRAMECADMLLRDLVYFELEAMIEL